MSTIIKIVSDTTGRHDYQKANVPLRPAADWCVVPEGMLPLENFPYGDITYSEIEGQNILTSWTPRSIPEPPTPPEPTPEELRRRAYESEPIIEWPAESGELITVDQANQLYLDYFAEGNQGVCTSLQTLIANAKTEIRNRYPD